ncbi:TIGR02611 family protein [Frondihabitans cladoniiphilus]|uniref:Transmembrane protein PGPGW n=1 Tax=Frondihabitans cladoniiphilus TaxID=715785 RepID=A0ABP8WB22_9MICO
MTTESEPQAHVPVVHHRLRNTRVAKRARLFRARLNLYPRLRTAYKVVIGVFGFLVIIVGIIMIPLPGPGWLVVFLGLAILGTEFPAAHRLNMWVQRRLHAIWAWIRGKRAARVAKRQQRLNAR